MGILNKIFGRKKDCFACTVEEYNLKLTSSYTHECGKPGKTIAIKETPPIEDKRTFSEWLKEVPLKKKPIWECRDCGTTDEKMKSTMDIDKCDSCWLLFMACMF